jgi:hypothetical protein
MFRGTVLAVILLALVVATPPIQLSAAGGGPPQTPNTRFTSVHSATAPQEVSGLEAASAGAPPSSRCTLTASESNCAPRPPFAAQSPQLTPRWQSVATTPYALENPAIVYDPMDGYTLLSSSSRGDASYPSTWAYVGGNWSRLFPAETPMETLPTSVAYDALDGYVIAQQGGENATWAFRGGAWTNLTAKEPGPIVGESLAYDPGSGSVVLFGGGDGTESDPPARNETWQFHGGNWSRLATSVAPSPRVLPSLAYDAADGYLLLFGGSSGPPSYTPLNDTWAFANGTWTQLQPAASPPACPYYFGGAMTYDAAKGEIVLVGSCNGIFQSWWTFRGGNWTAHGRLPAGVEGNVTAGTDDPIDGYVIYAGCPKALSLGCGDWSGDPYPVQSYFLRQGNWTSLYDPANPINPGWGGPMAFDARVGYVIDVAGTWNAFTTWKFAAEQWSVLRTPHTPSPRYGEAMAYDPADGVVLLYGGISWAFQTVLDDTWIFNGSDWTPANLSARTAPPPLTYASMAYDGRDSAMILFGGASNCSPSCWGLNETWEFQLGNWSRLLTAGSDTPPGRCEAAMAYDTTDSEIVLMGSGYDCVLTPLDTWVFSGGNWTNISARSPHPPTAAFPSLADDPVLGGLIAFGGDGVVGACPSPGFCGQTWLYRNGSWSNLTAGLPISPEPRYEASMTFDRTDGTVVLLGGVAYLHVEGGTSMWDTWILNVAGAPAAPAISSFGPDPAVAEVGESITFRLSIVGGSLPFQFTYFGLPPGCSGGETPSATCTVETVGTFDVSVIVGDGLGRSALASAALLVNPRLELSSFGAAPGNITLGSTSRFLTNVSGGVTPVLIAYASLPPGCASADVAELNCTPTASGSFAVSVVVQDDAGRLEIATTELMVTGPLAPGNLVIVSFTVSPATVSVNEPISLVAAVDGGQNPITFSYGGLPTGCSGSDSLWLNCTPTSTGEFLVQFNARDGRGETASAEALLSVAAAAAPLSIRLFVASPNPISAGDSLTFYVVTQGGEAPLSYHYTGLPSGCPAVDLNQFDCVPTGPAAPSNVAVTVTDSTGANVGASLLLSWEVPPPPGNASGLTRPSEGETPWATALALGLGIGVCFGALGILVPRWYGKRGKA